MQQVIADTLGCSTSKRSVGVIGTAMMVYFNVCGGPWGSEQVISAGGPLIGLVGVVIFSCFLAIPSIMMTTELSAMFPSNGGYSIWVKEALGPFWGFQESWWSWGSGVVDSALYPIMFFDVLRGSSATIDGLDPWNTYFFKLLLLILFSIPNFFFIQFTGRWLLLLFLFTSLPFLAFSVAGVISDTDKLEPSQLLRTKSSDEIDWATLLSVLYWNFSGFDCISTISGEVKAPARTIWYGSLVGWSLMVALYTVPLAVATCVNDPSWVDFDEGSFADVAKTIQQRSLWNNEWLTTWLAVASAAAFIGQYSAELLEDSFQLLGVAEANMLPAIFAWKHPRFRTPWFAIVFQMGLVASLLIFDFNFIVIVDNSFSILSFLLEVMSLLVLRTNVPSHVDRPFKRVALFQSRCGIYCVMICPVVVASGVFVVQFTNEKWWVVLLVDTAYILLGFALAKVLCRTKNSVEVEVAGNVFRTATLSDALLPGASGRVPREEAPLDRVP
eukprot:g4069.t1